MPFIPDEDDKSAGRFVPDDQQPQQSDKGFLESVKDFGSRFIDTEVAGMDAAEKRRRQQMYDRSNAASAANVAAQTHSFNDAERAQQDAAAAVQEQRRTSVGGQVADTVGDGVDLGRDLALGFVKGGANTLVKLPLAASGVVEDLTGTRAGMEGLGYRSKDALGVVEHFGKWMDSLKSDSGQARDRDFNATKGVIDTLGEMGANPAMIMDKVSESLVGIGVIGKTAGAAVEQAIPMLTARAKAAGLVGQAADDFIIAGATKIAQVAAPVSEGLQSGLDIAGTAQEAGRTIDQYGLPALAAGVGTAAVGFGANKLGAKAGIGDIETDIALRGTGSTGAKTGPGGLAERFLKEGAKEGFVEELPQSVVESTAENLAMGRPWDQGLGKSAVTGALTGFGMGGGHAALSREGAQPNPATPAGGSGSAGSVETNQPQAPVNIASAATNTVASTGAQSVGNGDTTEAEKALRAPVQLTALDRANEIDTELARLTERQQELTPENGYGPAFEQERTELAQQKFSLGMERDGIAKTWPKAVTGAPASFSTEAGVRLDGQYALMDAADLVTSHDEGLRANPLYPPELQPRDRSRSASELQVSGIVQKLDPARLGLSADAATGAPIVGADGLVESGNARTIALKRVYQANGQKAEDYRQFLRTNAAQFGITPESVDGMAKPVLVRVRATPVNRAEFARQANASTVQRMSPSEQALSDSKRLASLEGLKPDDNGDFDSSYDFIRQFMGMLPVTEQSDMIESDGKLSTFGYRRIQNAVLAKAYGDSPTLRRMTESMDDNLRNITKALTRVAPAIAGARERMDAGTLHQADVAPDLIQAVEGLSALKDKGWSVADELGQGDLTGPKYSPEAAQLLTFLNDNMRSPRRIAEFLQRYYEALESAGDPSQGSMFGDEGPAPTRAGLINTARGNDNGNTAQNPQRGVNREGAQADEASGGQPQNAPGGGRGDQGNGATGSAASGETRLSRAQPVEKSEWVNFPKGTGTIGIPRADMPQVKGEHRGALIQFLQGRGITHETKDVPAKSLKPTQAEFSTKKAARWSEVRDGVDRSVLVSSDGHILDGHHQWVAALAANESVKAIVLDAPIRELMADVFQFPSVKQSEGAAKSDGRSEARQDFKKAMAELADLVADTIGARAMMMPPNHPKLRKILVDLFASAVRVVGTDIRAATKWVKEQLKANAETKTYWNKITDEEYKAAALEAVQQSYKDHVDDLFSAAEKRGQADMFSDAPAAKADVAMIDGRAYDAKRDNFVAPHIDTFLAKGIIQEANNYVEKYFKDKLDPVISEADRARAEDLLKPLLKKAQEAKVEYDQKIIDIAKKTGALGQMIAPLKGMARAIPKLVIEEAFNVDGMKDVLRSTIVVSSYADAQGVLDEIAKQFELTRKPKNRTGSFPVTYNGETVSPEDPAKFGGYSDLMVNVRLPNGVIAEIQINVPEMLGAKEGPDRNAPGHKLYEAYRDAPKESPLGQEILRAMLGYYAAAYAAASTRSDLASATKSASDRSYHSLTGPLGPMAGRAPSEPPSSDKANQSPDGNSTKNPPSTRSANRQPSGNLSGTNIDSPHPSIVAKTGKNAYTSGDLFGANDADLQPGERSNQAQGTGAAQATGSQGRTEPVRPESGGTNPAGDSGSDNGGPQAQPLGQAGSDGARSQNENGNEPESGEGSGRHAGIPAGRDVPTKSGLNYAFGDEDLTYDGSWQKKAAANVDAVELLRKLETENRQANPEEQKTLAKFVGWGAGEIANSLFGSKLDKTAAAISDFNDALASMDKLGRDYLQKGGQYRGQYADTGYYQAVSVLRAAGKLAQYDNPQRVTKEQLQAAKPDAAAARWVALRDRLKALLTKDEWAEASRSTQYAHYTSKSVVKSMWAAMERMGFKGGTILEPGAGIGVFPGLMPSAMAANSSYTGIEFDGITGGILKQLFPDERILVESFMDSKLPKNFYDVAVGNPPFQAKSAGILSDPEYAKHAFALHDYFFAKSIDRVKPGGLVVYVTSRYTMDKLSDKARQYLAERADLVGAIRLPQTAFKKNAGTDVVTDIIFLRKKVPGQKFEQGQAWSKSVPLQVGAKSFPVNEYFHAHPEMVLGTPSDTGKMQNSPEPQYTVLAPTGDIEALFAKAIENLPADIYQAPRGSSAEAAKVREIDFNPKAKKEGNYYVTDAGALMQREGGVGQRVEMKSPKDVELVKDFVPLRDALKQAHYDQLNDGEWETSLRNLQTAYAAFSKKHGQINQFVAKTVKVKVDELNDDGDPTGKKVDDEEVRRTFPLLQVLKDDPDVTLVQALENLNEDTGEITPSAFLEKRVLVKTKSGNASTPMDAMLMTLNDIGHVDIGVIAQRVGLTQAQTIEALGSSVYNDPENGWVTADEYLSGNVKRKLELARSAAQADRNLERNVTALEANQPEPLSPSQIDPRMGMNWIPSDVYSNFVADITGGRVRANVSFDQRTKHWTVEAVSGERSDEATSQWGTPHRNMVELMDYAVTGRPLSVYTKAKGDDKPSFDEGATEAAKQKLDELHTKFSSWVFSEPNRTDRLVRIYNDKFNTTTARKYDGTHLTLPGASTQFDIFKHVKRGAWRIIQSGNTYLAHAVGSGKTFQMVISAMEQKRLGLIQKPMVVVPNHMLKQFAHEWQQLYPAARLMVADEHNFHTDNRRRFVSRVALSDLDGVIITHSAFKLLDLDPAFKTKLIQEQLEYFRAALEEAGGDPDKLTFDEVTDDKTGKVKLKVKGSGSRDPKVKRIEKQLENMEQKLLEATSSVGKDKNVRFDELGVDFLYVDEAHAYRKLDFSTRRDVKGLSPTGSGQAFDLYMKTRYLESKTPGRSLVLASGTPVTNTVAELYTVQKLLGYQALVDKGIEDFDSWASMFGREKSSLEPNAAGKYEMVTRFQEFANVPELTQMFREFADVLTSDHLAQMLGDERPQVEGGTRKIIVTPETKEYDDFRGELERRMERSKAWKPSKDEPNNPDPVIRIIGDGRLAAIDMRFMNATLPSNPDSKLNRMIDDVIAAYKETAGEMYRGKAKKNPDGTKTPADFEPAKGSTMMVFSDLGFGAGVAASRGFNARAWFEKRLRDAGIPVDQFAFMSDYKKSSAKLKLFSDLNAGRVRILVGSSKNMGTGVNAQQRLKNLFHLDSPWYPADLEQREGRIIRTGNKNKEVRISAYASKGTYDQQMWGQLANKQMFIDKAMSGDPNVRKIEDAGAADLMSLVAGMVAKDPRVLQLAGINSDIGKLQRLYQAHEDNRATYRGRFNEARFTAEWNTARLPDAKTAATKAQDLSGDKFTAMVGKVAYPDRTKWAEALIAKYKDLSSRGETQAQTVGEISGFKIAFSGAQVAGQYRATLMLETAIPLELVADPGTSPMGVAMRAQNAVFEVARLPVKMQERITEARAAMDGLSAKIEAQFPMLGMLADKVRERDALMAEMAGPGTVTATAESNWFDDLSPEDYAMGAAMGMTGPEPVTRLSRGAGGGMEHKALQTLVANITAKNPNMPKVHVLADPSKAPKGLREYIIRQDAWNDVDGAMHNGELYLFASGLSDALRAEHVLAEHEAAHFGLRALLGDSLKTAMNLVWAQNNVVRKAATELQKRGKLSNAEATEEVIVDIPTADLAKLQGWRKLTMLARDWLGAHGFDRMAQKLTDWLDGSLSEQQRADLFVAELVRGARDYVAGKRPGKSSALTGTRLSTTLAEDIAEQEKWLQAEAKARGYKDIEDLLEKNYPVFEKLATLWRTRHPADTLLSRAPVAKTATERAETILATKAGSRAPLDAIAKGLTRITGLDRLTGAIYNRAGFLLDRYTPEHVKAGLVADYGVPEAVIDQRVLLQGRQRVQLRKAGELIEKLSTLTRAESRVAYEWMNETDPHTIYAMMQNLPEESVKVLMDVQKMIDSLSKEAVRMGQLSPEAYERNKFAYLRRSYAKHVLEQTTGEKAKRSRVISILGDQYKGRGLTEQTTMDKIQNTAPEWWKRKLAKGKADTSLKGEKFIRLERRAANGQGVKPLPGMDGKADGKLREVAYWPAGETIPSKFSEWSQAGTFEVRDVKGPNVILWRDFTKDERETMGEVDEARFAIAKTLHGMVHDVEVGRYLEWMAHNYAKKEGEAIPGTVVEASERYRDTFAIGEWVRVPDTKISGTTVFKYGKLAGRYLPGPVWNDLRQTVGGQFKPFGDTYAKILGMWKTAKTALSPAVHMNNVMSNFVMADWHDVGAVHIAKSLRILLAASQRDGMGMIGRVGNVAARGGMADREAAREILARYTDSGGDIGSWVTNEIAQEQLEPMLESLEKELAATAGASNQAQVGVYAALQHALMLRFPSALEAFKPTAVGKAIGTEGKNLIGMYQSEDDVFRMAAWLKAKEEGMSDIDAGKRARKSFLDYHINAPWVQGMRQSAWPFISFTYRAVPMLAEIAGKKPHKLLKLMLIAGGLNALGAMMAGGGGDEEKDRKLLPEEKAGSIWGMVPKLIRMPWNDANSSPVYLDIRRFIPVGDVFDTGAGHSAVPILPGLMPGGPLVIAGEVALNKSAFTGKNISLDTDTGVQKATKLFDHLYKAFMPNLLGVPGTYATTGVMEAAQGKTDTFGREQSVAQAVASSFGMKLGSYPADVMRRNLMGKAKAEEMEIDKNIAQLKRQRQTNRIDQAEFEDRTRTEQEKKQKILVELGEKMK